MTDEKYRTPYREDTFRDSPWTIFSDSAIGGPHSKTPYKMILIQAPTGVATDIFKKYFGFSPLGRSWRYGDEVADYHVHEAVRDLSWVLTASSLQSLFVVKSDAIPYIDQGVDGWAAKDWQVIQ